MIYIVGVIVFLLLSAFFSGSEIAFVSANKLGIAMQKEEGSKRSNIVQRFYNEPKKFLSTMLIGNNIALVAFTICMTILLEQLFPSIAANSALSLLVFTLIITVVVLVFGEYLPKILSSLFANQFLTFVSYILLFFKWLLAFPTWFMTSISNGLLRIFGVTETKEDYRLSKIDLEDYLEENVSEEDEDIDKEILTNALSLKDIRVRDCMIPRTEIVSHDINAPISELITVIKDTKLSRILLIDDDIEDIVGYIHHQQLLSNPKSLKKIALDLPFVPEAMNLNDLLQNFIKQNTNIAVVVDEFGSTAGIITLEDILEEIFGEIEDEHDVENYLDEVVSAGHYRLSGRLEIDYLNEKYEDLNLPTGEYQTLSGLVVTDLGSIPQEGQTHTIDNYEFVIDEMSDKKIEIISVIVHPSQEKN